MPRIEEYTHIYYSILKSINQKNVFADERDKKKILDIVRQVRQSMGVEVYAYCVLDHEVHFILHLQDRNHLSELLERVSFEYTQNCIYDGKNKQDIIQKEYQAVLLEDMKHILEACSQIHLLPCVHRCARKLGDYWWNSYNDYIGKYDCGLINTEVLMNYLNKDKQSAIRQFRGYHKEQFNLL